MTDLVCVDCGKPIEKGLRCPEHIITRHNEVVREHRKKLREEAGPRHCKNPKCGIEIPKGRQYCPKCLKLKTKLTQQKYKAEHRPVKKEPKCAWEVPTGIAICSKGE